MFRKLLIGVLGLSLVMGCEASVQPPSSKPLKTESKPFVEAKSQKSDDKFLCAVEHREKQSLVKTMDLYSRQVRATFVPGKVKALAGDPDTQTLYIHSQEGNYHSLYTVDVKTNLIKRATLFNQVGLVPEDFVISKGMLYVVGYTKKGTALMRLDLATKQWKPIVYDIKPGDLELGASSSDLQILNFGNDALTRTTVNVVYGKKVEVNFNFSQQDRADGDKETRLNGVISRTGKHIYANLANRIGRYRIQSNQLVRMSPIYIQDNQARYVALSPKGETLYATTDQPNTVLRVSIGPNHTYGLKKIAFPGNHSELVVF